MSISLLYNRRNTPLSALTGDEPAVTILVLLLDKTDGLLVCCLVDCLFGLLVCLVGCLCCLVGLSDRVCCLFGWLVVCTFLHCWCTNYRSSLQGWHWKRLWKPKIAQLEAIKAPCRFTAMVRELDACWGGWWSLCECVCVCARALSCLFWFLNACLSL